MSRAQGQLAAWLLAVFVAIVGGCGGNVCAEAAAIASDDCGLDSSEVDPECSETDACVAQCIVDHEDEYCSALRGESAALKAMDGCTSQCTK